MCAEFRYRQAPGLRLMVGIIHGLALLAVLSLTFNQWFIQPVLMLILAASYALQHGRISRNQVWQLVWSRATGWQLAADQRNTIAVRCHFEFISPLLVVINGKYRDGAGNLRLVFTPGSCPPDHWRRLHILASAARVNSGVADDDVLGGEIDGHQDRIPRNG